MLQSSSKHEAVLPSPVPMAQSIPANALPSKQPPVRYPPTKDSPVKPQGMMQPTAQGMTAPLSEGVSEAQWKALRRAPLHQGGCELKHQQVAEKPQGMMPQVAEKTERGAPPLDATARLPDPLDAKCEQVWAGHAPTLQHIP